MFWHTWVTKWYALYRLVEWNRLCCGQQVWFCTLADITSFWNNRNTWHESEALQ